MESKEENSTINNMSEPVLEEPIQHGQPYEFAAAAKLRKEIEDIDLQLYKNGSYIKEETDEETGKPVTSQIGETEALRLKRKLILEAERLEGYPWSERSHTGLKAWIAGLIRAVKYAFSPQYRKAANALNSQMIQAELHKTVQEAAKYLHSEKELQKQEFQKERPLQPQPPEQELEKEKVNECLKDPEKIKSLATDSLTDESFKTLFRELKKQEFEKAKEEGRGENWWKKESYKTGIQLIQKFPVLAKGLTQKEVPSYAASILLRSPQSAAFFKEEDIKTAIPRFMEQAQKDSRHDLDWHINRVLSEGSPSLKEALNACIKGPNPALENHRDEILLPTELSGGDPLPTEMPGANPFLSEEEKDDGIQASFTEPEKSPYSLPMPEENPFLQPEGSGSWRYMPEFEAAILALEREDNSAAFFSEEELKRQVIAQNPELLKLLPEEDITYDVVVTAALNDLSSLKYIPENRVFEGPDGLDMDMDAIKAIIQEEIPGVAAQQAALRQIPVREVMEEICRDPKEADRRTPADRRDVAKLKAKIMDDFEKAEQSKTEEIKEKPEADYTWDRD